MFYSLIVGYVEVMRSMAVGGESKISLNFYGSGGESLTMVVHGGDENR